jgi:hypothetical protein
MAGEEIGIHDNEATLHAYGYELSKTNDTTTAVFRKIKLKSKDGSDKEQPPFPSEDSLQVRPALVHALSCLALMCLVVCAVFRAHSVPSDEPRSGLSVH